MLSCGLKKEKQPGNIIDRLREIAGAEYVRIYKIIQDVQVFSAFIDYVNAHKVIVIIHQTGRFQFPIENIKSAAYDSEVESIFMSLITPIQQKTIAA